MRSYTTVKPSIWMAHGEVKPIMEKYGAIEVMLYLYLLTTPQGHLSGIFQCPVIYIANETNLSAVKVNRGLKNLSQIDLVHVDTNTDVIWIPRMLGHAAGRLAEADNRLKGIKSHLNTLPSCLLVDYFCESNDIPPPSQKGLVRGLQGASKGTSLPVDSPVVKAPVPPKEESPNLDEREVSDELH